jgi:GMP synthase-like glutamine amidotransferase
MRVLAFRHVPFEGVGRIAHVLGERGISLEYADLYRPNAVLPQTSIADGLIFLGGPMSVNDPLAFLDVERQVIIEAIERNQPVLGICLGSQLIAQALGGRVYPSIQKEIGWFDIRTTDAAHNDALFRDLRDRETVFHWHGETWDLPAGATLLASSDACPNQAFRFGSNVYGVQFHPEVSPAMIADWCLQDENCGDVHELEAPIDPAHNAERLGDLSRLLFGRWCNLL